MHTSRREPSRRRAAWFALVVAVLLAHGVFGVLIAADLAGFGEASRPRRIEVALVRALAPTAPPTAPPEAAARAARAERGVRAVRPPRRASAPTLAERASAPDAAASSSREALLAEALALAASNPVDSNSAASNPAAAAPAASEAASNAAAASGLAVTASTPVSARTVASAASVAVSAPSVPAGAMAVASAQPALAWPPSTRLTYKLGGLYRGGPLYGSAVVEWRRDGLHYQVQFDFHVSPFFDQQMFSDGRITDDGLHPSHYDESRRVPLFAPRTRRIELGEDEVTLGDGSRVARLPRTQDPASQFVQFVWMFTAHPQWLRPGNVVEIPLALPTSLRRWQYRVGDAESLALPFGNLDAVHLSPVLTGPRKPNEYPFEIWTAPSLQYLPVRIRVLLDDQNFADLSLDSLPLQAAPAATGAASSP